MLIVLPLHLFVIFFLMCFWIFRWMEIGGCVWCFLGGFWSASNFEEKSFTIFRHFWGLPLNFLGGFEKILVKMGKRFAFCHWNFQKTKLIDYETKKGPTMSVDNSFKNQYFIKLWAKCFNKTHKLRAIQKFPRQLLSLTYQHSKASNPIQFHNHKNRIHFVFLPLCFFCHRFSIYETDKKLEQ